MDFDPTTSDNPDVELDIYGGKHTDLWGVDWNFKPYYYAYPSAELRLGAPKADYFELINQFTKAFGPVTLHRHLGLVAELRLRRRHRQLPGRHRRPTPSTTG